MENNTPTYYIAIPTHIMGDVNLSPTAKLLYGVIDSFQLATGVCYASNARLAEEVANCSERTISRCVAELKDGGFISVVTSKVKKGKQPVRQIRLTPSATDGQGVDNIGDPPRQNCLPPLDKNGDIVTKKSKKEKKTIDPLPVFVSWITDTFNETATIADKNSLYLCLKAYAEMRSESKSPLNTQRKVDGLLEDLKEKSKGSLPVMCEMLTTAKRRCWLSVHAPGGDQAPAPQEERQYKCV